jgi:hypothetical protein
MDRTPLYVAIGRELRRLIDSPLASPKPNITAQDAQRENFKAQNVNEQNPEAQMWADIAAGVFNERDGAVGIAQVPAATMARRLPSAHRPQSTHRL